MKIGLIGALSEEILKLKSELYELQAEIVGPREYFLGTMGRNKIVMTLSGWGKVAAASTATTLINHFEVDHLLFIGLAGSLDAKLEVGDIVIADKLIQHDVDLSSAPAGNVKSPFWKEFKFDTDKAYFDQSISAIDQFIENLKRGKYPDIETSYSPKVYTGTIGTGDQFVDSSSGKKKISELFPEILCTEMEGAAIAQVAADYKIPCSVIRIISDKADEQAQESFSKFLFSNISHISVEIAKLLFTAQ